jgi:hypothetical protein
MTQLTTRRPGFESPFPVAVSQVGPTEWELTAELVYHGTVQTFTVPVGQTTDFASVPSVLTWLVPLETGVPAAVLHDYLWRRLAPAGEIAWRDADGLLRQALGTLGVPGPRRWLMFAAVRWGSLLTRRGGHKGWIKDAPAVLAVTAAGLPLAAFAAPLLIPMALLAALDLIASTFRNKENR